MTRARIAPLAAAAMLSLLSGLAACQTAGPDAQASSGRNFSWVCPDGARFAVRFPNDETAILSHNGHRYSLTSAMSASGARYQGQGFEYWEHQGQARFTDAAGAAHENCRAY
jgi:membrane-bound inhibitor of C-type lysozyme